MMDEMIYMNELEKRSQEEIERRLNPVVIGPLKPNLTPITEGGLYNTKERRALSYQEVCALVPKHLKVKKDIPTVIEYQGRRYILDDNRNRK